MSGVQVYLLKKSLLNYWTSSKNSGQTSLLVRKNTILKDNALFPYIEISVIIKKINLKNNGGTGFQIKQE